MQPIYIPFTTPNSHKLTHLEQRIYEQLIHGYSNQQIADILSISIFSTKIHVSSILSKLKIDSRARLIALYYIELLDLEEYPHGNPTKKR